MKVFKYIYHLNQVILLKGHFLLVDSIAKRNGSFFAYIFHFSQIYFFLNEKKTKQILFWNSKKKLFHSPGLFKLSSVRTSVHVVRMDRSLDYMEFRKTRESREARLLLFL